MSDITNQTTPNAPHKRRGTPCSICSRPDCEAIDRALTAGSPLRQVAASFNVRLTTLYRHHRRCLAPKPEPVAERVETEAAAAPPVAAVPQPTEPVGCRVCGAPPDILAGVNRALLATAGVADLPRLAARFDLPVEAIAGHWRGCSMPSHPAAPEPPPAVVATPAPPFLLPLDTRSAEAILLARPSAVHDAAVWAQRHFAWFCRSWGGSQTAATATLHRYRSTLAAATTQAERLVACRKFADELERLGKTDPAVSRNHEDIARVAALAPSAPTFDVARYLGILAGRGIRVSLDQNARIAIFPPRMLNSADHAIISANRAGICRFLAQPSETL